jgi:hypothetical protein
MTKNLTTANHPSSHNGRLYCHKKRQWDPTVLVFAPSCCLLAFCWSSTAFLLTAALVLSIVRDGAVGNPRSPPRPLASIIVSSIFPSTIGNRLFLRSSTLHLSTGDRRLAAPAPRCRASTSEENGDPRAGWTAATRKSNLHKIPHELDPIDLLLGRLWWMKRPVFCCLVYTVHKPCSDQWQLRRISEVRYLLNSPSVPLVV